MQPYTPVQLQPAVSLGPVLSGLAINNAATWKGPVAVVDGKSWALPEGMLVLMPSLPTSLESQQDSLKAGFDTCAAVDTPCTPITSPMDYHRESTGMLGAQSWPQPSGRRSKEGLPQPDNTSPRPSSKAMRQLSTQEERQREKNRLAQHRYRARIKSVMSTLSEELATLQQEVSLRDREIQKLEQENKILRQELEQLGGRSSQPDPQQPAIKGSTSMAH